MFWGQKLTTKKSYKTENDEQLESSTLHVTNAALSLNSSGKAQVYAKIDGKQFVIAVLESGKNECTAMDLYFHSNQEAEIGIAGSDKCNVDLTGYFEPELDDEEGDFEDEDEDGVEMDEAELKKLLQGKVNGKKQQNDDDEEEDDEDFEDVDEEDDEDQDEDEEDDEDEDGIEAIGDGEEVDQDLKKSLQADILKILQEDDDEEEVEEEEDDEEEEEVQAPPQKKQQTKPAKQQQSQRGKPGQQQQGGDKSCFNCGKTGHFSRECTQPKKQQQGGGDKSCFNCGKTGHMSRECTQPRKQQGGGNQSCYNCGKSGHMSRECPQPKKQQGGRGNFQKGKFQKR